MIHSKSPLTARELLVIVAGDDHAEHTVVNKATVGGELWFICNCGEQLYVVDTEVNRLALRNVCGVS